LPEVVEIKPRSRSIPVTSAWVSRMPRRTRLSKGRDTFPARRLPTATQGKEGGKVMVVLAVDEANV
jgi:hypothetical protein